ncbi:oligogalacturonate lyase family protein [Pontibacter sp. E15-1]|uniref:oligogalacturonate lyase family protein n=1 Tax=Pontibacter sp. E15-1 TaxID=2919918 RepID=UPI001F4FC25B|nr:oligogalacturonate lyase family protein [Pontibacter sp. E15-1]MCJ8165956.1 oligogalacturonate lyase family protein [Pontibacter sp. E15-1]
MKNKVVSVLVGMQLSFGCLYATAQQVLETGAAKPMPPEWIDKDTGHKVVRLSRNEGSNASFYFHNNPFLKQSGNEGDKMVYYSTDARGNKQLYTVNLKTLKTEQLTDNASEKKGEIIARKLREAFYQSRDSVFATNTDTRKTRLVYVFPEDVKGSISTLNADETLLAGSFAGPEKDAIYAQYPEKSDYFNRIFDANIPHTLFTIHLETGKMQEIHQENTWLGHIQFSPTNPDLLMFCHEGPWHKVDRIWTYDMQSGAVKKMHTRTVEGEIAGHEFFSPDGKTIWFDQQVPRGKTFYLTGADVETGKEKQYQLERNEWSIHFNVSPDQQLFAGDGGDPGQVAKATDGMWIYLFRPLGNQLKSERLVNMKHHYYKLEPNVHFSPDGKWVIFRANFEGESQVYAVEIEKSKKQQRAKQK